MLRQDRSSCKSIQSGATLLFTSYNEVRNLSEQPVMLSVAWSANDSRISGFDVDMRRKLGYFSSEEENVIYRVDMRDRSRMAALHLRSPSKMAVEWTTGNVYVISGSAPQQISVCSFRAKMCGQILHMTSRFNLKALAVDAHLGRLFYVAIRSETFGLHITQLHMSRLDGSRRELLLRKHRSYVTAIATDPHQQMLYFVDLHSRTLEMISYGGRGSAKQRQSYVLLQKSNALMQPTGLSIYENHAYIVNMGAREAVRCQLYGQRSCKAINLNVMNAQDIIVAGVSRQPLASANPCQHAHCTGMCVLADYGYECMCGDLVVPESQQCPQGITNEIDINSLLSSEQRSDSSDDGGSRGAWLLAMLLLMGVVATGIGYMFYQRRQRGHRDLNINLHFQNPLATLGDKSLQEDGNEVDLACDSGSSASSRGISTHTTATGPYTTEREPLQFGVPKILQRFLQQRQKQNSEMVTQVPLENTRVSKELELYIYSDTIFTSLSTLQSSRIRSLVNERGGERTSSNALVSGSGDDAFSAGHYGGDDASDDVHARLVP